MLKKKSGIGSYFGDDNSVGNNLKKRTDSNIINQIFEGSDSPNSDTKVKYVDINVDDITPRSINNYSQTRIEKLAKSIQNTGNRMIHPIVVNVFQKNSPLELIEEFIVIDLFFF